MLPVETISQPVDTATFFRQHKKWPVPTSSKKSVFDSFADQPLSSTLYYHKPREENAYLLGIRPCAYINHKNHPHKCQCVVGNHLQGYSHELVVGR